MRKTRVVVVGAGVGGLCSALDLAAQGFEVTVLERATTPGGKLREHQVGGARIDAGPTVFTMRWVFDELLAGAGHSLERELPLVPASILARHTWDGGARLDLHARVQDSAEAIAALSGPAEARRFTGFAARSRDIYRTLEQPFIRNACASPQALVRAVGARGLGSLWRITPFETLWRALGTHFHDPRLRQLFGRYATYCGSSPFLSPATLMLVAHVEQDGVWMIRGGMHALAQMLARVAQGLGTRLRYGAEVARVRSERGRVSGVTLADGEVIEAEAVVLNADSAAASSGLFGPEAARAVPRARGTARSLSAITWSLRAASSGFPLHRHNVFFSSDYAREFDDIFSRGHSPTEPTVYVCAQDRGDGPDPPPGEPERLLCLVNAPADGDANPYDPAPVDACANRCFDRLSALGLQLHRTPQWTHVTTPRDFHRLFPATGGALYGPASHGWMASFNRAGARSRMPGLYLCGGSTHPGPGVPMAALSGRMAAASLVADFASTARSATVAMPGGMSTR